MAFNTKYTTSVHGKRLGLQAMSTVETGAGTAAGKRDFLVGAEGVRVRTSTAESTAAATGVPAFGVSVFDNSSAGSSQVFTLDPPIPGVMKTLVFETTVNTIYVKTRNGEFIKSSQGTTNVCLVSSQLQYASVILVPESTGAWAVVGSLSSGFLRGAISTTV